MTDLRAILPSFPVATFPSILPAIDRHALTTTDLLTLHPADIAKQTQVPLLDLKRFIAAVQASLFDDLEATSVPVSLVTKAKAATATATATATSELAPRAASPTAAAAATATDTDISETTVTDTAVTDTAVTDTAVTDTTIAGRDELVPGGEEEEVEASSSAAPTLLPELACISTLDPDLDAALGGGVPVGRITEFAGESGAGKTQFLLSLCLAVQLPPPHGIGRKALYISTESGLATSRLAQMLRTNDVLRTAAAHAATANEADGGTGIATPSLDNILSTPVLQDLESQDHILQYQVPVLLARHDIGLIILDSVAANYRAEFERQASSSASSASRGSNMAARSAELIRLGALLRDMARRHDLAVVVANQVADRFSSSGLASPLPPPMMLYRSPAAAVVGTATGQSPRPRAGPSGTQDTPLPSRLSRATAATMAPPPPSSLSMPSSMVPPPPSASASASSPPMLPFTPVPPPDDDAPRGVPPALLLDHQQRWFTGWGDDPTSSHPLKTPSLGVVWSTQIAVRVALFKRPVYGQRTKSAMATATAPLEAEDPEDGDRGLTLRSWQRWMKVVFAPHAKASGNGVDGAVEFEITAAGLRAVTKKPKAKERRQPPGRVV